MECPRGFTLEFNARESRERRRAAIAEPSVPTRAKILLLVAHVAQAALAMPPATRKRARVPKPAVKVLSEDAIERPQEDRRGYRLVELANRMQVLLISDPTMDPELAPKMDDENDDEESGEDEVSASDDGSDDGEDDGERGGRRRRRRCGGEEGGGGAQSRRRLALRPEGAAGLRALRGAHALPRQQKVPGRE